MDKETSKKGKIVKLLNSINNGQSMQTIFFDWVAMMAICIANGIDLFHGKTWQRREDNYLNITKKYSSEELRIFAESMAYLAEELEEEPSDVLGEIYHKIDAHNKRTGQFFTPFHLPLLLASLTDFKGEEKVRLNEPSCGAGGMILAVAKGMKDKGINYTEKLEVITQDIDWNCVYMTYVQLSLAGIKAKVVQGNTLMMEEPTAMQRFYTPAYVMM